MEELERALPWRFKSYLIRDPEEQRRRSALGDFLRSRLESVETVAPGHRSRPMPAAAERIRSTVRYYLENTSRRELADEFDRVMEIEPDTEIERRIRIEHPELGRDTAQALAAEKQKRAYARGAMIAKLSEEFANLTPEMLEPPVSDMDFRRLSRPYLYLNALSSQMEALLAAPERDSEILFSPDDRKICSRIVPMQPVADRVVRQMKVMSNPYYAYLDVNELICKIDHDICNDLCKGVAAQGGAVGNFALDIKAAQETSLGYDIEGAAAEADRVRMAHDEAFTGELEKLKKVVKTADPFYLLQGSREYDILRNTVESCSAQRMPELRDPAFSEKLRNLEKATKKLYKDSCRYLKYKGEEVSGRRDRQRVEAAKAVREYAVQQMERLKKLKHLKSVMDDFDIQRRRREALESGRNRWKNQNGEDPAMLEKMMERSEFYKQGKQFTSIRFRKANKNTAELDRRLKRLFFPEREFDLYGALGLDRQAPREELLTGKELTTARELISHLTMKQVLRDEQRRMKKTGADSKICQLADGIPVDDFRKFMAETPSLAAALEKITREDVCRLVAGEDRKALRKLSRKVALELPAVAETHLDRGQGASEKKVSDPKKVLGREQKNTIKGKGPAM